jgi:SAM-dependent methyltransferase
MQKDVLKKYFEEEVNFNEKWQDSRRSFDYSEHLFLFKILKTIKNKFVLSLSCGVGREVKTLVNNGNKVVGVDFAENVIKSSKEIEPNAEYHCMDVVDYLDDRKYDYILGLVGLFNYIITKEKRKKLTKNMKQMLKKDGEIIIGLNLIRLKDSFKLVLAPITSLILGEYRDYSFGDIYYRKANDKGEKVYFIKTHLYTKRELKKLFKNMNFKFIQEKGRTYIIRIH